MIAVLDDDLSFREALAAGIVSLGHDTVELATAAALFDLIAATVPACLILDYNLPDQNGLEVQRTLVMRGIPIPVVFVSACQDERIRRTALSVGAAAFLAKPVRLAELEAIIAGLLGATRQADGAWHA